VLFFNLFDTAYSGTHDDTDPKDVLFGKIQSTVIHSLACRGDSKLSEAVHSFAFAVLDIFCGIELLYLAAEPYRICAGVKGFNDGDTAFPLAQRSEKAVG
jgi:hypothetical protein